MTTSADWSRPEFASAIRIVRERTGLVFSARLRPVVEERLRASWARCGRPRWGQWISAIRSGGPELEALISELTVGETYFFRDPDQLRLILSHVLPERLHQPRAGRGLRVWSAGCASGEEAYSVAILLREAGLDRGTSILGTDICGERLERAERGVYSAWSLRGVREELVRRHFTRNGDRYQLSEEMRGAVRFRALNLAEDRYPSIHSEIGELDIVLCRNVLIYLDPATVTEVGRRLVESLRPGGWLFLGASDPVLSDQLPCEVIATPHGLAYRRLSPRRRWSARQSSSDGLAPKKRSDRAVPDPESDPLAPEPTTTAPEARPQSPQAIPGDEWKAADEVSGLEAASARSSAEWALEVQTLANRGRLEDAARACAAALEAHPASPQLLCLQARLSSAAGHHEAAAIAARRALYLDPKLVMAHLALGHARLQQGDKAGASLAIENAGRLLGRMQPDETVAASDGQSAGRLTSFVNLQMKLLSSDDE